MSLKTWDRSERYSEGSRSRRFVFGGRSLVVLRLVNDLGGGNWVDWQILQSESAPAEEASDLRGAFRNARAMIAETVAERYAGIE